MTARDPVNPDDDDAVDPAEQQSSSSERPSDGKRETERIRWNPSRSGGD